MKEGATFRRYPGVILKHKQEYPRYYLGYIDNGENTGVDVCLDYSATTKQFKENYISVEYRVNVVSGLEPWEPLFGTDSLKQAINGACVFIIARR